MTTRYRVIYSPRAFSELEIIFAHIAQDSVDHAIGMVGSILDSIDLLQDSPHRQILVIQPKRPGHPIRSLPVRPFIVYFRVLDDDLIVHVLRIRHGAQRRLKRF